MLKSVFDLASPAGSTARLSVLIFHRVSPTPDMLFPDEVDARFFDELCSWLKNWLNILPLDEAVVRLKAGTLPSRAASITFDDGYSDNFHVALPILKRHGLVATFFIATGFLDGGRMWNDTVIEAIRLTPLKRLEFDQIPGMTFGVTPVGTTDEKRRTINTLVASLKYLPIEERILRTEQIANVAQVEVPTNLMMTSSEVKLMRQAGMLIGAHTVSHPILATLGSAAAYSEIANSKSSLENLLGESVGLFAYPNGKPHVDFNSDSVAIVRELGFDAAVTTRWASSQLGTDPLQIPRFSPWDKSRLKFGARLIKNLFQN